MSVLLWCFWLACTGSVEPQFQEYAVVRGDTLFVIARDHGVTLDELRKWNALEGDLIEVGQVLRIGEHDAALGLPAGATRKSGRRRSAPKEASSTTGSNASLPTPKAKKCLAGPTGEGLGDEFTVMSAGLSKSQISAGMNAIVGHTLTCVPATSGRVTVEVSVGCNGLVSGVHVADPGPYDPASLSCIRETLEHASFDAHQLPDGDTFRYPLVFTF